MLCRNLIIPVVNGEFGLASQSNDTVASIGNRKPKITYFRIKLFDLGFFRPEGGGFRRGRLNECDSKIFSIDPNSAAVEEFVFG